MLFRAGGPWLGEPENASWRGQALPAGRGPCCFLLHLGPFVDALGAGTQHLIIRVDKSSNSWWEAALDRVLEEDTRIAPLVGAIEVRTEWQRG